jgi:hypothetical protein
LTGLAWAECRTVEIDGEEMELCDKEKNEEIELLPIERERDWIPKRRYRNGDMDVEVYEDGTHCVSRDVNGFGLIQTNCY